MKRIILIFTCLAVFAIITPAQTVTDYDGNIYDTIIIGSRLWLKENLKTTHYRDGTAIPNVTGGSGWATLTTGARCYYNNDSSAFDSVYGALYNWYAVNNTNGICPSGWHVPSDAEWTAAESYLGGSGVAGGKMKESGTLHWSAPNAGATNSSGFTGLPGGMLGVTYNFQTLYENGLWWTSTQQSSAGAWSRYLYYLNGGIDRNPTPKTIALSIRCIKDVGVGLGTADPNKIKLYPNPSKNSITVEGEDNHDVTIWVYNVTGEPVMPATLTKCNSPLDISALPSGIYIVTITFDSQSTRQKFIKK